MYVYKIEAIKKACKQFCNQNCALINMYWTIIIGGRWRWENQIENL